MTAPNPQTTPPDLDPRIYANLPTAMATLVRPTINANLAPLVPEIIASVDAVTPGARPETRGALHAALWLLADDLHSAHVICQDIPTLFGSALHAHLHRREGDFSNSIYWWRRAKGLKWYAPDNIALGEQVAGMLADAPREFWKWREEVRRAYDPIKVVELVERHHMEWDSPTVMLLRDIQRLEWSTLFLECFREAKIGR